MKEKLQKIKEQAEKEISSVGNSEELESLRVKYIGRKGEITLILRGLGDLPKDQKPRIGKLANETKKEIEEKIKKAKIEIQKEKISDIGKSEWIDITASGTEYSEGRLNPVTLVFSRLFQIARSLGFQIIEGPEVETDWYNFESLNIPKDHPARDVQDSLYFSEEILLRTHTSPVQIRYMENNKPPLRIIVPGRVYRRDFDVTHTPMFHQLEGLLVDDRTTFSDLKGILEVFVKGFFGEDRKVRFRPHYFPFTEPSAEVDVSCGLCGGKGCRSCKFSGWLEVLGAGMVHPNVLKNSKIDPQKFQGFAFGMGIERLAMLKYNISDLRIFFENDLRFLEQF